MGEKVAGKCWNFGANEAIDGGAKSIRDFLMNLRKNVDDGDFRAVIPLSHGDPSPFPSFRTDPKAVDAVCDALRSAEFNSYASTTGIPVARKAIAEYMSRGLSSQISPDDVYVTSGCGQAIEILISVLARPGANILLPRPSYPMYDSRATFSGLEVRYFDLLPENDWEVDLNMVEAISDERTAAIVIINPCNPCGNVLSRQHLKKIAEMAGKLGIMVIADEVYERFVFGSKAEFVSMGEYAEIVPVIKLGAISKSWFVPGWRLGWMITFDPLHILKHSGFLGSLEKHLNNTTDPVTFIQGAIPDILGNTKEEFFVSKLDIVRECAEICYEEINKIPCFTCPSKPQGAMFVMVQLNMSMLEDIKDDSDFCLKLAKEEAVILLPGEAVGMKNWVRITFAVELDALRDGFLRLTNFARRHIAM